MCLRSGKEVNLAGAKVAGTPTGTPGPDPGSQGSPDLTHQTVVSQHPERPQGPSGPAKNAVSTERTGGPPRD